MPKATDAVLTTISSVRLFISRIDAADGTLLERHAHAEFSQAKELAAAAFDEALTGCPARALKLAERAHRHFDRAGTLINDNTKGG